MKSIFKFLYFNKNERIALFVFLCLLVSGNLAYHFLSSSFTPLNYEFVESSTNWIDTISEKQPTKSYKTYPTKKRSKPISNKIVTPVLINMNQADSVEFSKLKGIGKVFSSRIVRYRNWLGGFYTETQLLEVYGIDSLLFKQIRPYLSISIKDVIKININTCSQKNLSSHPYISYKIAKSILKYREHHGFYKSINDLKRIPLIDEELFRKIAFYLELE